MWAWGVDKKQGAGSGSRMGAAGCSSRDLPVVTSFTRLRGVAVYAVLPQVLWEGNTSLEGSSWRDEMMGSLPHEVDLRLAVTFSSAHLASTLPYPISPPLCSASGVSQWWCCLFPFCWKSPFHPLSDWSVLSHSASNPVTPATPVSTFWSDLLFLFSVSWLFYSTLKQSDIAQLEEFSH